MVTIRKCGFCGMDIGPGTGKMLVAGDGSVAFYCSSKCEKNVGLGRSSRKIKWTQAYRKEKAIRVQHLSEKKPEAKPAQKAEKPKEKPAEDKKEHKKKE